jgi:hypothetical protein
LKWKALEGVNGVFHAVYVGNISLAAVI